MIVRASGTTHPPGREAAGLGGVLVIGSGVYLTLLGGSDAGAVVSTLRALNAVIAGGFILYWVRSQPGEWDAIDVAVLFAVVCFAVAGVLSLSPRSALDATTAAAAWGAALYVGRRMAGRPVFRRLAVNAMAVSGTTMALLFGALWAATWARWLAMTDFTSWPPLTLALPTLVFRHPHVVAYTVVLLLPAVVVAARSRPQKAVAALTLLAAAYVALASGSRTIWAAATLATIVVILTNPQVRTWARGHARGVALGFAIAVAALALVLLLGPGQQVLGRLTTLRTLGIRGEIWQGAWQLWVTHPLAGVGPGHFVGALPLSGYFAINEFAPRHADNAVIQLLVEGGLLALAGTALAAGAAITSLVRGRRSDSLWAIAFFGFSMWTDNPTDTAGLVALLVAWLSLGLPAGSGMREGPAQARGWRPVAMVPLLGVLGLTYAGVSAAGFLHEAALRSAADGEYPRARDELLVAVKLDPGMSLYQREVGLVSLAVRETQAAVTSLRSAHHLAPTDRVTLRLLAMAEAMVGDQRGAERSIEMARGLAPGDIRSQLVSAALLRDSDPAAARRSAVMAIELDPLIAAAAGWAGTLGAVGSTDELLKEAWRAATVDPVIPRLTHRPMWLRAMISRGRPSDSEVSSARAKGTLATSEAWSLLLGCHISQATQLLIDRQAAEEGRGLYWFVRLTAAAAGGEDYERVRGLAALVSPSVVSRLTGDLPNQLLDPTADRRLYGRNSLTYVPFLPAIPSPGDAMRLWMTDPIQAASVGAPATRLASCAT